MYLPITRPLFNLCLMFLSLSSGLEDLELNPEADKVKILQQKGVIEALRFVIQPFGLKEALKKFEAEIINSEKNYNSPAEIEEAELKSVFKQEKETNEENKYRATAGTTRCHENACNHCKYNHRFGTKFCWDCDRGTNFKNGIRSIGTIEKMLNYLDTQAGEALLNQERDEEMTIIRVSFAEGLKWIMRPYTTEESLIEKNGKEYVSNEDMNLVIQIENEDYEELDNYDESDDYEE